GSEHDDHGQVLGDVGEPVVLARRDVHDRPGLDLVLPAGAHQRAAPAEDDVDLVLGVRLLAVLPAYRDAVRPDREVGHAQVLSVLVGFTVPNREVSGCTQDLHTTAR